MGISFCFGPLYASTALLSVGTDALLCKKKFLLKILIISIEYNQPTLMELVSIQDLQRTLFATKVNQYFECASLGFYSSSYKHFHQNLRQNIRKLVLLKYKHHQKYQCAYYFMYWADFYFLKGLNNKREKGITLYEDR